MTQTFMAAEIAETGAVLRRQLEANSETTAALAARLTAIDPSFAVTIARGSSDNAALLLNYAFATKLGLLCASVAPSIGSLYRAPLRLEGALSVAISQSGASPDIVAMQQAARQAGAFTLAFVNDGQSQLALEADALLPLHAGIERSVAATKSMIAACVAGLALIARWADDGDMASAIARLPGLFADRLQPQSEPLVAALAAAQSLFVIGRGPTFAVALEAALKLKETAAIHAEGFSSAEVLHGPAGIVGPSFPVLGFAPTDAARSGFFETMNRLASFGAAPLIVDVDSHASWPTLVVPDVGDALLTPVVALHAFYRLTEAVARRRGRDPDAPPHLSKVTRTV